MRKNPSCPLGMQKFYKSTQLQLYFAHKKMIVELTFTQKVAFSLATINLFIKWNLLFHLTKKFISLNEFLNSTFEK